MLTMNEQELEQVYELEATSSHLHHHHHQHLEQHHHHHQNLIHQSDHHHPQHGIHQVQLVTGHQEQEHGGSDNNNDEQGIIARLEGSAVGEVRADTNNVHDPMSQQHTITHTIQLHSTPTHLVEILVSSAPSHALGDSSMHSSSLGQSIDMQQGLNGSNSEIVVVAHDMNGIHPDDLGRGNEIVTVVPIMNGNELSQVDLAEQKLVVALNDDQKIETTEYCKALDGEAVAIDIANQELLRARRKPAVVQSKVDDYSHDQGYNSSRNNSLKIENMSEEEVETTEVAVEEEVETQNKTGHDSMSDSDDSESGRESVRKCVVCLRQRKFTEDIYDSHKQVFYHVDVLLAHLNIQIKKPPKAAKAAKNLNSGICPECMDHLQRWHIFHCAIGKRHEAAAESPPEKSFNDPIPYESFEARVYRNYKKMSKVKEVFSGATHAHYARRHLTEKDWDFFCDHLFHSNSVKSEKSRELERFVTCREKLSSLYCTKCNKLIPNGKKGFTKHMRSEHSDLPLVYPCDICGCMFPEKDMTASTEDYYPHWISHFYFNKCDDCGKRFPTKRALGQHRHAVHKNRQVKCDKCGKVLANKMSLDLHLLRHLPENEKKKYMIKCKVCKKKIAQWNLKSHMATHNDERPWKCDHCEATFKMKGALVSHRDVVHFNLKNHVCSICNEAFKSASSLRGHVRRHEGRKDYKCDVCEKEYYTYSALKGHKVVHQTARDFICEICGKAFKKKKALDEHGTIHTGEKPHQCPICGREIRVKSNLYKHMKIHKKNPSGASSAANNTGTSSTPYVPRRRNNNNNNNNSSSAPATAHGSSSSIISIVNNENASPESEPSLLTVTNSNSNMIPSNSESMSSISEISSDQNGLLSHDSQQAHHRLQAQQTTFMSPHYQTSSNDQATTTLVHTISMPHQHQDLLNVPVATGHFYNAPQYFGALDPMQN